MALIPKRIYTGANESENKRRFNVKKIGVCGSYALGDASEESDVDILVEFDGPIGWEFTDMKEALERKFR